MSQIGDRIVGPPDFAATLDSRAPSGGEAIMSVRTLEGASPMPDSRRFRFLPLPFVMLALLAALALARTASAAFAPGAVNARTLISGSTPRLYDVYAPPGYDGSAPVPLVLDVHGYTSNKTQQRVISGMKTQADLHGFLVAYPQGLFGALNDPEGFNSPAGPSWNSGDLCCGAAQATHVDDVAFLLALVHAIAAEGNVDLQRVYVTGISNGGGISHRLACEAAGTFAAAAPVSFPIGLVPLSACQPSRPIPVLHFAGLTDTLVPYAGGPLLGIGPVVPSAAASFARWRDLDGCGSGPPDQTLVFGASQCETYLSCAAGTQVGLCSVLALPLPPYPGHVLYWNDDLDVADTVWQFLSQFQAPAALCGDGILGAGEECDDGNLAPADGCDADCKLEPCGPTPEAGCRRPIAVRKSQLKLRDETDDTQDRLQWKWTKGFTTTKAELGAPLVDEDYHLCIYAGGALRSRIDVAAGGTCGDLPCWRETSKGFKYKNEVPGPDGATQLVLTSGEFGKARFLLKGAGANLAMPGPLSGTVTVQLEARGGYCWQALFPEPYKKNDGVKFLAVGE
jgi:polyhydroxybutyrate depolymerase